MQVFHTRSGSLLFPKRCVEQSLKQKIVPMGIYEALICHRQKHVGRGSGKATVFFVAGSGSWRHFCISVNTGAIY